MIFFRYPIALLLLLLVPLLVWLRYARRRQPALTYPHVAHLSALPKSPWLAVRRVLPPLYACGLVCLILALSRPQTGMTESVEETEGVDIVLLVDTSTSMRAEDFSTATQKMDRLDAAKSVMEEFIQARKDDRIGIVIFAALPYVITPLTTDHGWLLQQMNRIQTGMLEDGTGIGDGIASAANRLRDSKAKSKVIILLTDGINNAGALSPIDAAQAAAALGIKVYTIGAGSDAPQRSGFGFFSFGGFGAEIDEATLRKIADITGGTYHRATDLASLKNTYREIDQLEKTKIELEQYTRYEEQFAWFVGAAAGLLLLESLLKATRLGRLP